VNFKNDITADGSFSSLPFSLAIYIQYVGNDEIKAIEREENFTFLHR
jgi:hypothetical protein